MSRDLCGSMVADSWLMPIFRMPPFLTGLLAAAAGAGVAAPDGGAAAAVMTGFGDACGAAATAGAVVAAAAGAVVAAEAGFGASVGLAAGAAGWAPQAVRSPAPMPAPRVVRIR